MCCKMCLYFLNIEKAHSFSFTLSTENPVSIAVPQAFTLDNQLPMASLLMLLEDEEGQPRIFFFL